MRKKKTKRWLRAILWTLILWWWIIISNDILTNWLYITLHYWKFIVYLLFIYRFVMSIIKIFNLRKYISYDEGFNYTKRGNGILMAGWVLAIVGITLMCVYNKEIKVWQQNTASYLSSHIEFREWKIPVIYVWEVE